MPTSYPDPPPRSGIEKLPDPQLVEAIRRGEVAAFRELYQRYWTRLASFAFRYLHSADEAQDVVQDVFFRIWRAGAEWRVRGRVDNYLYLAVRNGAFDRLKHAVVVEAWRRGHRAGPGRPDLVADSSGRTAQDLLEAGEQTARIERALAELPERRRAVCTLRWVDGLTYAEIAARLGITEKTVENQITLGLRMLRSSLSRLGG